MSEHAQIAIIGGSGLYSMFAAGSPGHIGTLEVHTKWGSPSGPIEIAEVGGRRVAFIARHGSEHQHPPHSIPYRANIEALRSIGVRQVISPCASGSLREQTPPGTLVVPDQLVDQTHGRPRTFYDRFEGQTFHAQFAEPFCSQVRASLLAVSDAQGWAAHDGGAIVVIDGPSFSTRAEVEFYARQGWGVVNMTAAPEAVLAREAGLCYATLALVTNYSANLVQGAGVSEAEVYELFERNIERMRDVLTAAVGDLPDSPTGACAGIHS